MTASTERPKLSWTFNPKTTSWQQSTHWTDCKDHFWVSGPGMWHEREHTKSSLHPVNTSVFSWSPRPRTLKCWELCARGSDRDRFLTIKQEKWDLVEFILEQEQLKPFQKLRFLMVLPTSRYGSKPAPRFWALSTLYSIPSTVLEYHKATKNLQCQFHCSWQAL